MGVRIKSLWLRLCLIFAVIVKNNQDISSHAENFHSKQFKFPFSELKDKESGGPPFLNKFYTLKALGLEENEDSKGINIRPFPTSRSILFKDLLLTLPASEEEYFKIHPVVVSDKGRVKKNFNNFILNGRSNPNNPNDHIDPKIKIFSKYNQKKLKTKQDNSHQHSLNPFTIRNINFLQRSAREDGQNEPLDKNQQDDVVHLKDYLHANDKGIFTQGWKKK